jgi:hypothetical protein
MEAMRIMKLTEWIGMVFILIIGILHIYSSPDEFNDAPYLGIMFIGAFVGSIIAAIGIYRHSFLWGWGLGALIALGSCVGYILSRTVGLPISGVEPWGPGIGYFSLLMEILFLVTFTRASEFKQLIVKVTQGRSGQE